MYAVWCALLCKYIIYYGWIVYAVVVSCQLLADTLKIINSCICYFLQKIAAYNLCLKPFSLKFAILRTLNFYHSLPHFLFCTFYGVILLVFYSYCISLIFCLPESQDIEATIYYWYHGYSYDHFCAVGSIRKYISIYA